MEKTSDDLTLLNSLENNAEWLDRNMEKLKEKFESKFVAIENQAIVADAKSIEALTKKLKKEGKTPATMLIKFIYKKGFTAIF